MNREWSVRRETGCIASNHRHNIQGANERGGSQTSVTENKQHIRRNYDEVCNQLHFDLLDDLAAENYQHHNDTLPPAMLQGRDNFKQVLMMFYGAFPDLNATVEDLIAEDDRVVARISFHGTQKGDLMGVPASGNTVDFPVIEIYRVANGRVAEGWALLDVMGLMQQIGAIPAAEPQTA